MSGLYSPDKHSPDNGFFAVCVQHAAHSDGASGGVECWRASQVRVLSPCSESCAGFAACPAPPSLQATATWFGPSRARTRSPGQPPRVKAPLARLAGSHLRPAPRPGPPASGRTAHAEKQPPCAVCKKQLQKASKWRRAPRDLRSVK
jgi:hypothetical protein